MTTIYQQESIYEDKSQSGDDRREVEHFILYLSLITTRQEKRIKAVRGIMTRRGKE